MDFYVELFSNFDSDLFSQNTIANFITKLYTKFELTDSTKIGLSEISFPKTWYNIKKPFKMFCFDEYGQTYDPTTQIDVSVNDMNTDVYKDPRPNVRDGTLKAGFYDSVETLIVTINAQFFAFSQLKTYPKLLFDNVTNKMTIVAGSIEGFDTLHNKTQIVRVFPYLGEEIELLLGLKNYKNLGLWEYISDAGMRSKYFARHTVVRGYYEGFRPVEINAGIDNLLVYCDLVYPQPVGDASVKLLRTVEIPNRSVFGDTVVIKYDFPHYLPILYKEFETIEIDVRDDSNRRVDFLSGRIRIKLHFKNG